MTDPEKSKGPHQPHQQAVSYRTILAHVTDLQQSNLYQSFLILSPTAVQQLLEQDTEAIVHLLDSLPKDQLYQCLQKIKKAFADDPERFLRFMNHPAIQSGLYAEMCFFVETEFIDRKQLLEIRRSMEKRITRGRTREVLGCFQRTQFQAGDTVCVEEGAPVCHPEARESVVQSLIMSDLTMLSMPDIGKSVKEQVIHRLMHMPNMRDDLITALKIPGMLDVACEVTGSINKISLLLSLNSCEILPETLRIAVKKQIIISIQSIGDMARLEAMWTEAVDEEISTIIRGRVYDLVENTYEISQLDYQLQNTTHSDLKILLLRRISSMIEGMPMLQLLHDQLGKVKSNDVIVLIVAKAIRIIKTIADIGQLDLEYAHFGEDPIGEAICARVKSLISETTSLDVLDREYEISQNRNIKEILLRRSAEVVTQCNDIALLDSQLSLITVDGTVARMIYKKIEHLATYYEFDQGLCYVDQVRQCNVFVSSLIEPSVKLIIITNIVSRVVDSITDLLDIDLLLKPENETILLPEVQSLLLQRAQELIDATDGYRTLTKWASELKSTRLIDMIGSKPRDEKRDTYNELGEAAFLNYDPGITRPLDPAEVEAARGMVAERNGHPDTES